MSTRVVWLAWFIALELVGLPCAAQTTPSPSPPPGVPADWPSPGADAATELPGSEGTDQDTLAKRPWARGVSLEDQDRARAIFLRANAQLNDGFFRDAISTYSAALRYWDHPGIHYNYALASQMLNEPLETRMQLIEASRFGPDPIGPERFERLKRYQAAVEEQLAVLHVHCEMAGGVVSIDGRSVFVAPGQYEEHVLPGVHLVRASKPRYVDDARSITLERGQRLDVRLKLFTPGEVTRTQPGPMPAVLPLAVSAAGIIASGVGGVLVWIGEDHIRKVDTMAGSCSLEGCGPDASRNIGEYTRDARNLRRAGLITLGAGAVTLAAGLVLLYLNRSVEYRVSAQDVAASGTAPLQLMPELGPQQAALVARGTF